MSRERIVVVCPGRGTYNREDWGYLARHHRQQAELLRQFDVYRASHGQPTLTALDQDLPYQLALHSRGDHASALIYACAWFDALAIDRERFEIVAVTGNSMGWYIALAVGQALAPMAAHALINTMGGLMHESLIGGQVLQPWCDDAWRTQPDVRAALLEQMAAINGRDGAEVYRSIELGSLLVFGGNEAGVRRLLDALPKSDRYPMRLHNHSAFHTPLQMPVRETARERLASLPFAAPRVPLIDGRGHVWSAHSTDPQQLWDYTLGQQLTEPYDFTRAVTVAVREFAPDRLVILGPGTTLGGAVAQTLIQCNWRGLTDKAAFQARQQQDPFVLAMGLPDQRARVLVLA